MRNIEYIRFVGELYGFFLSYNENCQRTDLSLWLVNQKPFLIIGSTGLMEGMMVLFDLNFFRFSLTPLSMLFSLHLLFTIMYVLKQLMFLQLWSLNRNTIITGERLVILADVLRPVSLKSFFFFALEVCFLYKFYEVQH